MIKHCCLGKYMKRLILWIVLLITIPLMGSQCKRGKARLIIGEALRQKRNLRVMTSDMLEDPAVLDEVIEYIRKNAASFRENFKGATGHELRILLATKARRKQCDKKRKARGRVKDLAEQKRKRPENIDDKDDSKLKRILKKHLESFDTLELEKCSIDELMGGLRAQYLTQNVIDSDTE
jgi:hypothetical protein